MLNGHCREKPNLILRAFCIICTKIPFAARASKINFGRIWINGNISQNYPELSIGGYKESGLNRETGSSGLKTYSEVKSLIANDHVPNEAT